MSDERLRSLERQWQESGSVVDEAAYLVEAVRSGAVPAAKLELASDLGHRAARIALSKDPLHASELPQLGRLLRQRWGQWQLVRASWAATKRVIPVEAVPLSAIGIEVRDALAAVEAWLASPKRPVPCASWRGGLRATIWSAGRAQQSPTPCSKPSGRSPAHPCKARPRLGGAGPSNTPPRYWASTPCSTHSQPT